MAIWKYACKTMQGMNLDLKLLGRSDLSLRLTKAMSGSGSISPTKLMTLNNIISPMQNLILLDAVERLEKNIIRIPVILNNTHVTEKYDMHQIGIYAEDPDLGEILYIVLQSDGAEEIPSSTEMKDFTLEWYLNITADNADNVEVVIDETCNITIEQGDARYVKQETGKGLSTNDYSDEDQEKLDNKLDKTGDGKDVVVTFTEAEANENISSGEKLSVILGKIKKFFSDLKTVAFTGSYNDLTDKPVANDIGAVSDKSVKLLNTTVTDLETNFRGRTYGENADNSYRGNYISGFRNNKYIEDVTPLHSSGIAFGGFDTHGWICPDYAKADVVVGAGNGNKLNWTKHLAFLDSEVASAMKATQDGSGHNIEETYATKESLDAKRDLAYTKLPDGSDLNDVTTPGGYYLHHQNTYINMPSQLINGFMNVVVYSNVVKQVIYRQGTVGTNDWTIVERTGYSEGPWSDWVEIVTEKTGFSYGVKTTLANPSAKTSYYIPFVLGGTNGNKNILQNNELRIDSLEGTASALGYDALIVGNNTPKGTEGNKYGQLSLYSESAYVGYIKPASLTGNRAYTLPDKAGTFAMTSDIVSSSATTSAAGLMSAADKTKLNALGFQVKKGTSVTINASRHCIAIGWVEDDYFCVADITTGNITNIWYNGCSFSLSGNTLTLGSASTSSTHFIAVWQE